MSSATTNVAQPSDRALCRHRPRSYSARVALDVLGRTGAKIGMVWIIVVAFFAVFAPFIANSHPLLLKHNDQWSSPLLKHLSLADVVLLVTVTSIAVLCSLKRISGGRRFLIFVGVLALTIPLAAYFVRPPRIVIYDQYRDMQRNGEVQFALHTPIAFSPQDYLRDMILVHPLPPSGEHWFGTDRNGGDIFSRMIHACRIAMAVGFIATGIAVIIGVIIGGLMAYFAGWVDLLGMRLVEVFSAIPTLYLLLAFVAFFGRNLYIIMAIIGATGWVGYALFTRAEFLRLRKQEFVQAAEAMALPLWSILFKHMLPNGVAPILVNVSFGVAGAILAETTLSFLGLGLVDEPSWGQLLNQAISAGGSFNWWLATFPGMAIFLTIFAYNLVGEAIRDAVDPRTARAAAR